MSADPKDAEAIVVAPVVDLVDKLPVFWLTRDTIGGALQDVDVWAVPPARLAFEDGDAIWLARDMRDAVSDACMESPTTTAEDDAAWRRARRDDCVDSWTIGEAKSRIGSGAPDNDRECVRCGAEPAPVDRARLS